MSQNIKIWIKKTGGRMYWSVPRQDLERADNIALNTDNSSTEPSTTTCGISPATILPESLGDSCTNTFIKLLLVTIISCVLLVVLGFLLYLLSSILIELKEAAEAIFH